MSNQKSRVVLLEKHVSDEWSDLEFRADGIYLVNGAKAERIGD